MQRNAILNIFIGFLVIVIASFGGFFLANEAEKAFLLNEDLLKSWQYTLFKSAHGHFNLFGMLHILMGLSLPYSKLPSRWISIQTLGLLVGTLTMGFLLVLRAFGGVPAGLNVLGVVIGITLSMALGALILHCYGLAWKLFR